jgi:hypothetical protein
MIAAERHLWGVSSAALGATEGARLSGLYPEMVWQAALLGSWIEDQHKTFCDVTEDGSESV